MHALLFLPGLLSLTTSAPINTEPLLLVLSNACESMDMYSEDVDAISKEHLPSFQILGFNETCGARSSEAITRASISTIVTGGAMLSAGWPGAVACSAITATTKALSRPAPAACAKPQAKAATLVFLAKKLHWRRVRLRTTVTKECEQLMREIEDALLTAGIEIRRISSDIDNTEPHVSVGCDDQSNIKQMKPKSRSNILPMLILMPHAAPAPAPSSVPPVSSSPTRDSPLNTHSLKIVNVTFDLDPYEKSSPSPPSYVRFSHKNKFNMSRRLPAADQHYTINSSKVEGRTMSGNNERISTNTLNLGLDPEKHLHQYVLVDAHEQEETDEYDSIIKMIKSHYLHTEIKYAFKLYESQLINGSATWIAITTFETNLYQSDDYIWHTDIKVRHKEFDSWCANHLAPNGIEMYVMSKGAGAGEVICVAGAALVALAAMILTIFATRRSLAKRMQRRPRAAVILSATDFQFPADEQRRVGEGMESMLSWLQQFHDLPGPEMNQPDLLKRPVAPSAPSSTCSVTRLPLDGRIRYKEDPVHMKYLPVASLELKRKAIDVLLIMQNLRHENINPFIGCLCSVRPALVFASCGRGSLEAVLVADEIRLDWTFRLSLLTDLVRGMRYLHSSPLRHHGRLTSRSCLVDARWVLRISDYGLPHLTSAQHMPAPTRSARDLLWSAPEVLREGDAAPGTQPGDVFSFAIIMQEVIVRGEPYCMLHLTPEEIIEKLCRPPPLIRPSVSMGAAPPEAVSVMRQCWSEQPDLRPDFNRLYEIFRHMHRGRKVNIVDSMFEMLEKYSNNLEELIKERTEQLDIEKKKTEQLLNRMLPRSVAERLMLGLRVQPEEFEEVSIYFSDIVGFTAIAARSTPVQVVDLLNDLYTTFDAAIEQYRVYKVETIGDAYMVVGGLPMRCTDHAQSIATMALHLLHLAGRFRIRHTPGTPLHLRIGLHTGPCCAGVVGLTMPRYCLFGDTVNTASRMESTGAAWRIQISSATADRLAAAGGYRLRSRGLTQVKGKGAMHTYWLLGKDGFDKPLPTPPPLESEEVLFETECENDSESSDQSVPSTHAAPVERQRSDPTAPSNGHIASSWQRSGAVSADSSPPALPARSAGAARYRYMRSSLSTCSVAGSLDTPRLAERRVTPGARVLRRQWSLERGDVLAAAAAEAPKDDAMEPLALRVPPPRPGQPRYRTRPDLTQSDER